MAKYTTDTSRRTTTTWDHDRTHVLFQWSSNLFHGRQYICKTVKQHVVMLKIMCYTPS
jgi:hypothetical protein